MISLDTIKSLKVRHSYRHFGQSAKTLVLDGRSRRFTDWRNRKSREYEVISENELSNIKCSKMFDIMADPEVKPTKVVKHEIEGRNPFFNHKKRKTNL